MADDDDHRAATDRGDPEKSKGNGPSQPDAASVAPDFASAPPAEGFDKMAEWQATVARLAALPPFESDRMIKEVVKSGDWPGLLLSTLRKAVQQARPKDEADGRAGRKIELTEHEPWPDPVNGHELLDELVDQLKRFLVANQVHLVAVALWIVHTHCFGAWWISPKLLIKSATKRCGKTRVFESMERLVARRLLVSAATSSAVFRVIAANVDAPPTLLMDEADKLTQKDDNMRKLINAGQTKTTAHVMISDPGGGNNWEPREFSTWAPIALAGIGDQADTIQDRAVTVRMKRKPKMQLVEKLRGNRDYGFRDLARKCARWAADHVEVLRDAEPAMPDLLNDRAQDNWEPLIAIADAAGGEWSKTARGTALVIQREAEELDEAEVAVQLLHDIDDVFESEGAEQLTSAVLLIRLNDMDEQLWPTYGKGGTKMSAHDLSKLLRLFEVHSKQLWLEIEGKKVNKQGYDKGQFVSLLLQYPKMSPRALELAEKLDFTVSGGVAAEDPPDTIKSKETAASRVLGDLNGVWRESDINSPLNRNCEWCGEPLPPFSRTSRRYCSDACKQGAYRATEGYQQKRAPNGPEPGMVASVPFMITQQMKADLRARGFTVEQISEMTPEQAHAHLVGAPEHPLERCAHCGGELARGDMLPLNSGGHVHHRCADDYVRARDAAPRDGPAQSPKGLAPGNGVSVEDLKDLCRRTEKAKGTEAVVAVCARHGVKGGGLRSRRIEDLDPQQAEQLRAELEAVLA